MKREKHTDRERKREMKGERAREIYKTREMKERERVYDKLTKTVIYKWPLINPLKGPELLFNPIGSAIIRFFFFLFQVYSAVFSSNSPPRTSQTNWLQMRWQYPHTRARVHTPHAVACCVFYSFFFANFIIISLCFLLLGCRQTNSSSFVAPSP